LGKFSDLFDLAVFFFFFFFFFFLVSEKLISFVMVMITVFICLWCFIVVWFLCNVLNILLLIMLTIFVVYWHRNWLYIAWVFFFFRFNMES
jgi:hypothetical protein